jgi:alpha-amylase
MTALLACGAPTNARNADTATVLTGSVGTAPADWRRGATCYEVFVRSFYDSNGDGIGDLNGLTQKLDYISDLGVRCIWLMPVAESPSYHGYDASDYYRVEPDYGTNADFKAFAAAAHARGMAVLVDMVLNHASSDHPYFREALGGPGAAHRDWFRWSTSQPAEKGPWGQDVWHRSATRNEYYYGVFWHAMPDLNYDTPAVREEAKKVATFWLTEMGADGFRLDAVPYLVEEGSKQIGTAGTHAFLREYAAHLRTVAPNAFTVGEVWDGIDKMLPYYPDQLESYFAFDLADSLVSAVRNGSAEWLLSRWNRFQREVPNGRWSTFVRNHDQTRALTALGGTSVAGSPEAVARAKLAVTLLLTLPGQPFIYYGEEIGMTGDKPDERLRTPMQWDATANAGFTRGTPWGTLQGDWQTTNVAAQANDAASLLALHRSLIRLRASNSALASTTFVPLTAAPGIAAYLRRDGDRAVLIVANLRDSPAANVSLSSDDDALAAGSYAAAGLLGGSAGAGFTVGPSGRVSSYVPLGSVPPRSARLFELTRGS